MSAARWPWWSWLVPWIALWLSELPLLLWNWGFTLSKAGAWGPLLPLGMYLGFGFFAAALGMLLGIADRLVKQRPGQHFAESVALEPGPRYAFRWAACTAWGVFAGALICYALFFKNPLSSPAAAWISTLLGFAFAAYLTMFLMRWADPAPAPRLALLLGLIAVGSFAVQPGRLPVAGGAGSKPNVLLITIDTCNRDHLSTYGYHLPTTPTLTAIAEEGVKFNSAWCQVALTGPSHGSIFSGLHPQAFGVYDNAKPLPLWLETLAERFRAAGYYTLGIPGNLVMLEAYNMHQGFDRYPQRSNQRGIKALQWEHTLPWRVWRVMWNSRRTSAVMVHNADYQNEHLLESLPLAGSRPWFTWLHYFDAHAPYEAEDTLLLEPRELPDADLDYLGSIPGLFDLSHVALQPLYGDCFLQHHEVKPLVASPEEIRDLIRIYDAQLRHIDNALNRLWSALKESGQLDNTLVIITADHGEALFDRGYFGHSFFLHNDEMRVPLIIWYGDQLRPREVAEPVGLTDLAPTIYDLTGITPPAAWKKWPQWAGKSLRPLLEDQPNANAEYSAVYMERFDHSRGIVTAAGQKLIYQAVMGKTERAARPWYGPQWLWFDLNRDPEEVWNLAGRDAQTLPDQRYREFHQLQGQLFGLSRQIDGAPVEDLNFQQYLEAAVSEKEAEMLRSLGYLQGPGGASKSEAECEQPVAFTTPAAAFQRLTGMDPTPPRMGYDTYRYVEEEGAADPVPEEDA